MDQRAENIAHARRTNAEYFNLSDLAGAKGVSPFSKQACTIVFLHRRLTLARQQVERCATLALVWNCDEVDLISHRLSHERKIGVLAHRPFDGLVKHPDTLE